MIITDRFLIYVEDLKTLRYQCRVDHITNCEVYQEDYTMSITTKTKSSRGKNRRGDEHIKSRYYLHVESKKKGFLKIENENYPIVDKVFTLLKK